MITNELKSQVDKIWETFWTGGISNPLTVVEQFTFLIFIKSLDTAQTKIDKKKRLDSTLKDIFPEDKKHLRWENISNLPAEKMFTLFQNEMFPFIKNLSGEQSSFASYMKDASFLIPTAKLLQKVVDMVSTLNLEDKDIKGDLYEYLLSKLSSAGTNGQFRTPRHIIKMMVELMLHDTNITSGFKIYDPACGTAGFLINSIEYIKDHRPEILSDLSVSEFENLFYGSDFDISMARIASMNMMLHSIESAHIKNHDAFAKFDNAEANNYDLILANPPFKGSLDYEEVAKPILDVAKTKKTELLFLSLILKSLKVGGRCAVIVPDGVLFGATKAHKEIRQEIVSNQQLDAIISMPSGVFKPYAGVSTAIIIFTKTDGHKNDKVWFYDMQNDGFTLNDNRNPCDGSNIPDILNRFNNLDSEKDSKRTEQSFFVPVEEIESNEYDLSLNRYKEVVYEKIEYASPKEIIKDIKNINKKIVAGLDELEAML
ncbi:SAM-dependent DNA methyltransferase [Candidatus Sulfurimonas marisnigri]|uniref:site-specific DNA-methyltransferase (adenine-specific) n=1 Tax=Candidatus Sulfurimonas marisnigri TaxID=2740405 RepID=A0A7S7M1C1_9BACT|nr:class I SAM-dependent DNA methyltransferase [Candidatus Sulfurimonas marisnigri]QOY55326.1 SAM-dependent DNA methyltransferase [Candidatus Sulfurimonas marisnigri]